MIKPVTIAASLNTLFLKAIEKDRLVKTIFQDIALFKSTALIKNTSECNHLNIF